jgi:HK97 gp10 family phage protein
MGFKMDFAGFDELATELHGMATDELTKIEDESLQAGAEIVKSYQERNWNRSDTGGEHIADNIRIGRTFDGAEGRKVVVAPIMRLRWRAKFVEYGTSYQAPQYPVQNSLTQAEVQVTRAMMNVMERVVA